MRYIAFYDAECGLCNFSVQMFLSLDKKGIVQFAPLAGVTAASVLQEWTRDYPHVDSIVFLEDDESLNVRKISYWSRAVFRFFYCLGGMWKVVGLLSMLPKPLLYPFDCIYRFIARRRRNFCPYIANRQAYKDRFLP